MCLQCEHWTLLTRAHQNGVGQEILPNCVLRFWTVGCGCAKTEAESGDGGIRTTDRNQRVLLTLGHCPSRKMVARRLGQSRPKGQATPPVPKGTDCALTLSVAARQGSAFSLRHFHDRVLSFGSIPVSLIASAFTSEESSTDVYDASSRVPALGSNGR